MYESFSGPEFERPGTTLFTKAELLTQIQGYYGHLPAAQQTDLATKLAQRLPTITANPATPVHPTIGQHGQHVERFLGAGDQFDDPQTVAEAGTVYAQQFAADQFVADQPDKTHKDSDIVKRVMTPDPNGQIVISYTVVGTLPAGSNRKAFTDTFKGQISATTRTYSPRQRRPARHRRSTPGRSRSYMTRPPTRRCAAASGNGSSRICTISPSTSPGSHFRVTMAQDAGKDQFYAHSH